ncbi:MAG: helix-turn-helix transcriptional regulator [Magnetococcales bacterium]|nr:helix-turn-helix transcriptional regulator [Magnetococcales bacterium]
MSAHTNAHLTELHIKGPIENVQFALKAIQEFGFGPIDLDDSIPWREVLPRVKNNEPGIMLSGARGKENLTQRQLSELTGIPQRHISEMENGKRPIGKKNAKLFAETMNVDYWIFL